MENRDRQMTLICTQTSLGRTGVQALDQCIPLESTDDLIIDLTSVRHVSEDAAVELTEIVLREMLERDIVVVSDVPSVRTEFGVSGLDVVVPLVHRREQAFLLIGRAVTQGP